MARDTPHDIPSMVPDIDATGREPVGGAGARRRGRGRSNGGGGGSTGVWARLSIAVAFVVAAVACAWAWQLQQQLAAAEREMAGYAGRIGDLEARLSDTDEGLEQNAQVMAVRVKELDSEVRKLWDNVWKRSKERLAALEAASGAQGKSVQSLQGDLSAVQAQLGAAADDLAQLKGVADDLSRLMASAKANQSEVERVADTLNRIELEMTRLGKRVSTNEEWVGSVNAFRKQVNASILELRATVGALQAAP